MVVSFQRFLYNPDYSKPTEAGVLPEHPMSWYLTRLSLAAAVSVVLLFGSLVLFSRLEDNFAEEI